VWQGCVAQNPGGLHPFECWQRRPVRTLKSLPQVERMTVPRQAIKDNIILNCIFITIT